MADQDLTVLGDLTINGSVNSLAIMSDLSPRNLKIDGNLNINQGIFELPSTNLQTIEIDGNITISSGGVFRGAGTGSVVHAINLYGGLINNGAVQFNTPSSIKLNMIGTTSTSIGGTNAGAQLNLGPLTIDKGTGQALEVNINSLGSIAAPSNNWLTMLNGTLRISRPGTLTLNDQAGSNFFLPATTALVLNHSGLTMYAGAAASDNCDFVLAGRLELTAGTMNIGLDANNNHNDLEYGAAGVPQLIVSGNSVLNVNGQIRRSVDVLLGSLSYTQSGNSTVLVRGKMPVSSTNLNRAKFEILNAGSQFTMSDNALLIIDRNGLPSNVYGDIFLSPASSSVTGGEIRVGTGNSGSNTPFDMFSYIPLYNLSVDGTATSKILKIIGSALTVKNNLRVQGESIFNANSLNVNIGNNLTVENTSAAPGLNVGGYRVQSATQVTTFDSNTGNQVITGTGTNLINFAHLNLNNSFPSGALSVAGGTPLRVASNLSLNSGGFNTANSLVTVLGNISSNVIHTSTSGGFIFLNGPAAQTISGNGLSQFGSIRLDNTAGAEILSETRINGELNLVNGIFYLNNQRLTLGTVATVTTPTLLNATRMIRLNGVASDAGLQKLYSAGAGSFTFPVGVTLKYTPATLSVASNSVAGAITVRPVNAKHPATTDPGNTELTYHWVTDGTGFSAGASYTHQYNYEQVDATNGNENNYVAGRYFSNQWVPQNGIPGTVNAAANTINLSGVNYINGEFTAGEPQEFGPIQVYYSITSGDWTDQNSWSVDPVLKHTGAPALVPPTFNPVVIAAGHTITGNANNLGSPTAEINGTLNLNNTIGHNFGVVTGVGTIRMTPTGANVFIFPGGTYSAFVAAGGGTVEYNSTVAAALPSRSTYNNILFTGTGNKSLYNSDILVNGNFSIAQGQVSNPFNKQVNLKGNFINNSGFTAFNGGAGVVNMSGLNQSFTGSTQFSNLTISGGGIKLLNASIEITSLLQLTNGIVETGGNLVIIPLGANVAGASAASYINGTIQKGINNSTSSKLFEIGDASRYTPVNLNFTGTISGTGSLTVHTTTGDHPDIAASGLNPSKSANRYWSIVNSGLSISAYSATFNFATADLDLGVNTGILDIGLRTGSWAIPVTGSRTANSTQAVNLNTFGSFQIAEQLGGGLTWTGSIDSDWHNPNNWLPVGVPGVNDDILVPSTPNKPNFPTLANGTCRNAVFQAGASITIPTNVTLTIVGNLSASNTQVYGGGSLRFTSPVATITGTTFVSGIVVAAAGANLSTNNNLVINNDGSLMHGVGTPGAGGSVSGNVLIRRTGFTEPTRYNYWSSPISNGSLALLGANKYQYNPVAATASSGQGLLAGWQMAAGPMNAAKGYIATNSGTVGFYGTANNGNLNTGSLSIGSFTASNLIGNPYPSAISAAALVAANAQIQGGAIYVWDDDNSGGGNYTTSDFLTWNGIGTVGPNSGKPFNGNIALGQGFFVSVANTSPVQFTNSMRTSASSTFFEDNSVQRFWLNVTGNGKYNETLIGFKPDATNEEDLAYDARKFRGSEDLAFYSCIGKEAYAIQALPFLSGHKIIQLGIDASASGMQTMRLGQIDQMDETVSIIVEDTKLGTFHNMRTSKEFSFNYDKSTDQRRFRLHLYAGIDIFSISESCALNDGHLRIHNQSSLPWSVKVTNASGLLVGSTVDFTGNFAVEPLPAGTYMVELSNYFGSVVHKQVDIVAGQPVSFEAQASQYQTDIFTDVSFSAYITGNFTQITWDMGDGNVLSGSSTLNYRYSSAGIYTVKVKVASGQCSQTSELTIRVQDTPLGLQQASNDVFNVYPNPVVNDVLNIRMNQHLGQQGFSVALFDLSGKLVYQALAPQMPAESVYTVPLKGLAPGVYQLRIETGNMRLSEKVIKAN